MHRLRLTIGGVAAAAALALTPAIAQASTLSQPGTAASPATDSYGSGEARVCNDTQCSKWEVDVTYHVTYNGSNVWINGTPNCTVYGTYKTWCGYTNNGQKTISIGMNYGNSGQYSLRVFVQGNGDCTVSPYNEGDVVYHTCPA